jgi:hypothetical protein
MDGLRSAWRRDRSDRFSEPLPVDRPRLLVGGGRGIALARRNLR